MAIYVSSLQALNNLLLSRKLHASMRKRERERERERGREGGREGKRG